MKAALMQPYFLPYIGYFQLIAAVDLFIVYDNIKYTKKGWINRNRMLANGGETKFSLPLKSASDFLDVREREVAADFDGDKLLKKFESAYRRAPHFVQTFPLLERVLRHRERNLFGFLHNSLAAVCGHLGIATAIRVSSEIAVDSDLKSQDRVLATCGTVGATTYVNAIGGQSLYSREAFATRGIELRFIKSGPFAYPQFGGEFVPWLSIVDVMMFNPLDVIRQYLASGYELI